MILPIHSQVISRGEVKETINSNGDTLVIMHLEDARIILNDLLEYEIADSLLTVYKEKDSLNTNTISLQKDVITKLTQKSQNQELQLENFQTCYFTNQHISLYFLHLIHVIILYYQNNHFQSSYFTCLILISL